MSEFDNMFGESVSDKKEEPDIATKDIKKVERKPKKEKQKQDTEKKQLHVLNEENLIIFIRQVNKTKKYEGLHRFYESTALEISNLIDKLIEEGKLARFGSGWIGIKK